MATKGSQAREKVIKTIQSAFGGNFVGINDKKIYVNQAEEDGAIYQFAIAITMPKNKIEKMNSSSVDSIGDPDLTVQEKPKEVISQEEIDIVDRILKDLGI